GNHQHLLVSIYVPLPMVLHRLGLGDLLGLLLRLEYSCQSNHQPHQKVKAILYPRSCTGSRWEISLPVADSFNPCR
ncbi:hypothetical protein RZS08_59515, partial [Arthrospira platensis SPKY1]|nr:hypothetical protein [Arthrospira platensis SPKY1]